MTSAHKSDDVRILKKQCTSLAKNPCNQVYLVARGDSYQYRGVNVVGVGEFKGGRLSRIFGFSKAVFEKAVEIDADIYEFHDPELLLYAKKLKKLGKKVIFDSHENYAKQITEKDYIPVPLRKIIGAVYAMIENNACKYIDAALFPTEDNPYRGRVNHCVTIYNTPILEEFDNEINFEDKEDCACCVGSLTEARGIRTLIEACHKANVKLILGGNFSPESFGEELKQSEAFSIVDYRGYCDREAVKDIYSTTLIGTDTILRVGQYGQNNNLSTKVYEYMANGMPYISSDFDYNKYIVDKYDCGICVDPSNSDEIAKAIRYLIDNKDRARKMGENGRKLVESTFDWKYDEERLLNLYEELYKE